MRNPLRKVPPVSTTSPVVVVATLHAAPGRQQDVIDALLAGIAPVHDEPGCELYALHAGPDDTVVIVEKWESAEALDAHAAGHAVAANDARLEGLLGGDTSVVRLAPASHGSRGVL
jgi:quinol monooxygenase YgiN